MPFLYFVYTMAPAAGKILEGNSYNNLYTLSHRYVYNNTLIIRDLEKLEWGVITPADPRCGRPWSYIMIRSGRRL